MKYVFMGTPDLAATILEMLCAELDTPVAVVTQPSKPTGRGRTLTPSAVEMLAKQQELMIIPTDDVNLPANVSLLRSLHPDLILVAAFGQLLKKEILELPTRYCLNVHASLLPKYRGAAPVQRAIWNGDKITGITIQKMEKKLDTGDLLVRRELAIDPDETSGQLMQRLAKLGGECLIEAVRLIESGKESFQPQNHAEATHAAKILKEDSAIDWNEPASRIRNKIRALQPWPIAETKLDGQKLRVFRAEEITPSTKKAPGQIESDSKTFLHFHCGDGQALSLTEIQLENKKRLDVKNFLAGFRGKLPGKLNG